MLQNQKLTLALQNDLKLIKAFCEVSEYANIDLWRSGRFPAQGNLRDNYNRCARQDWSLEPELEAVYDENPVQDANVRILSPSQIFNYNRDVVFMGLDRYLENRIFFEKKGWGNDVLKISDRFKKLDGYVPKRLSLLSKDPLKPQALDKLSGQRIVTAYPNILQKFLEDQELFTGQIVRKKYDEGEMEDFKEADFAFKIDEGESATTLFKYARIYPVLAVRRDMKASPSLDNLRTRLKLAIKMPGSIPRPDCVIT